MSMNWLHFLLGRRAVKRDGGSADKAIVVSCIEEEYLWIQQNCPAAQCHGQELRTIKDKPYDVFTLIEESGRLRIVFFDISAFFGEKEE